MRFPTAAALAFGLVGSALATPGVSPTSVNKTASLNSSFVVEKIVTTQEIAPTPDVVLLIDVTGSMGTAIANIKANLDNVISTILGAQPNGEIAVAIFGDIADPIPFAVKQGLTNNVALLQAAINSLTAGGGGDIPEDWINALYKLSTGAVTYREGSSRIIVLISDAPSHDPSGGHSLTDAINALKGGTDPIRVVAVNVGDIDSVGQATAVTHATGGVIIGSAADDVTKAIISGLKNLDVTVTPNVVSCDAGLTVEFSPTQTTVSSGSTVTFRETVEVSSSATKGATLHCSVRFLLNGKPGGVAFIQNITVATKVEGPCTICNPHPPANLCDITTSCTGTDFGTQCLCRPGFKADAPDDDQKVHWRLKWKTPGQEHRVAVEPGVVCNTLCDSSHSGPDVCEEVSVANCGTSSYRINQQVPLL